MTLIIAVITNGIFEHLTGTLMFKEWFILGVWLLHVVYHGSK